MQKLTSLRVVLSHMVVKRFPISIGKIFSLRVVLSHMVVKPPYVVCPSYIRLRVVLSHMVVKRRSKPETNNYEFESSVISYGSQTLNPCDLAAVLFESSVISYGSQTQP